MSDNVLRRILCKVAGHPLALRAVPGRVPNRSVKNCKTPLPPACLPLWPGFSGHVIDRVLAYLEGRRRVAEYYCHRTDAATYLTAWVTVFEAYHGPNPRPTIRQTQTPTLPRTNPHIDKPWYREKYGRPTRRVVGYVEHRPAPGDGMGTAGWYECALECGHMTPPVLDLEGQARPKHKRCTECWRNGEIKTSAMGVAELPGGGPALDKRTVPPGCKKPVRSENPALHGAAGDPQTRRSVASRHETQCGVLSAHRGL
jgi:hypothetical protein